MITSQVDEKTVAIFWLTSHEDPSKVEHFSDLNYLFDGLLVRQRAMNQELEFNFYIGNNFGKELYLSLAKESKVSIEQFLSRGIRLFENSIDESYEEQPKLIVLTEKDNQVSGPTQKRLEKKFSNFNFCFLS